MQLRLTLGLLVLLDVASGTSLAQGLGDIAAREKEKRSKSGQKAPQAVVTEGDLEKYVGDRPPEQEPPSDSHAETASVPAGAEPRASSRSSDPDPDAALKERAAEYKAHLVVAREYVAQAEARLASAEEHWHFVNSRTNDSFPLDEARHRLEGAKREAEKAHEAEDQILDAARREGILPGWLR